MARRSSVLATAAWVFWLGTAVAASATAAGLAAQRIVAQATLEALPAPLRSFYAAHLDPVIEYTLEPDAVWRLSPRYAARESWHYVRIDVAAEDGSMAARLKAARSFPLRAAEARKLFDERQVLRGGELIWRLDDFTQELTEAFRQGERPAILRATGYVIHFALDAADPFAATSDSRGEALGNPIFATAALGDPLFAHQDVAQRVGWELVRRNAERYRAAMAPAELRFELAAEAPAATLECLIESLSALEPLAAADREILQQMAVTDGAALQARADEFYPLLDGRCGEHAVAMLQRGTRLATTLIVSAWEQAGRPDLAKPSALAAVGPTPAPSPQGQSSPGASGTEAAGASPSPAGPNTEAAKKDEAGGSDPASPGGFVASRTGKVYHRPECSHAERINPENLVHFATRAEAEAAGRRPCRTCKPDGAPAP